MRFLAVFLLVLISVPAFAEEPVMTDRFGPGTQWYQPKSFERQKTHKTPTRVTKRVKAERAIMAAIPQTHERVAAGPLVAAIRSELGTNPTGWRRQWCAYYLRMKLPPRVAAKVDNRAISFLNLPRTSKQVGAIAVMPHHVGVVAGFDPKGNPIIISGNHSRRVGEGVYSSGRVIAYVEAL